LRQLPKEVWQLTQELPNAFNASSLIFPPKGSDLARALDKAKELFRVDRENGLVIFNPHRFEGILRQVGDDERLSIALRELFRPILPTVSEASEKYQVRFDWLLTKVASLPPPAPTMTETVRQRLEGVFRRIAENAEYRLPILRQVRPQRLSLREAMERIQQSPITINLRLHSEAPDGRSIAAHLVEDGRYMTKWEAVERKGFPSHWGTTFESDLTVQRVLFDIPPEAPPIERPVYGALNIHQDPQGAAFSYGRSYFVLKEEVKERATLFRRNTYLAMTEDDRHSLASFRHPLNAIPEDLLRRGRLREGDYIEVQIHGGVSLKDVDSLVIDALSVLYSPQATRDILNLGALIEALGGKVFLILDDRLHQIQPTHIQSLLEGQVPNL